MHPLFDVSVLGQMAGRSQIGDGTGDVSRGHDADNRNEEESTLDSIYYRNVLRKNVP